jgi:hypothetical protein
MTQFTPPAAAEDTEWCRFKNRTNNAEFWFRTVTVEDHQYTILVELTPTGYQLLYVRDPPARLRVPETDERRLITWQASDGTRMLRIQPRRELASLEECLDLIREVLRTSQ